MNAAALDATSVTVLTAAGRSAVAVVVASGHGAEAAVSNFFFAANRLPLGSQPIGKIVYGRWGQIEGEDLVVCRRDSETVEIHCHGGAASITQVVDHLTSMGCQQTDWQDWLAKQNKDSLTAAAHQALAATSTIRTAKILLDQYHGALRQAVDAISQLLSKGSIELAQNKLTDLLRFRRLGKHLTEPWHLVIAGQPNVGKSSLINAIVGYQRAIVFDQPGTTRDVISAKTAIDGWPIILNDTAGLHQSDDQIENAGIVLARNQLAQADLVVWVLEAQQIECETNSLMQLVEKQCQQAAVDFEPSSTLIVVNKVDLIDSSSWDDSVHLGVSAKEGTGLQELLAAISHRLVPLSPSPNCAVPFTDDQISSLSLAAQCCQQEQVEKALAVLSKI